MSLFWPSYRLIAELHWQVEMLACPNHSPVLVGDLPVVLDEGVASGRPVIVKPYDVGRILARYPRIPPLRRLPKLPLMFVGTRQALMFAPALLFLPLL